jgi:hypothetical protein
VLHTVHTMCGHTCSMPFTDVFAAGACLILCLPTLPGCCGDVDHFDLSTWAFEKMAANKWGVIGIWYREVRHSLAGRERGATPGSSPSWQPGSLVDSKFEQSLVLCLVGKKPHILSVPC